MTPHLCTTHSNINTGAAAPAMQMGTTVAEARVHEKRIAGPTETALHAAFDRFLQLRKVVTLYLYSAKWPSLAGSAVQGHPSQPGAAWRRT